MKIRVVMEIDVGEDEMLSISEAWPEWKADYLLRKVSTTLADAMCEFMVHRSPAVEYVTQRYAGGYLGMPGKKTDWKVMEVMDRCMLANRLLENLDVSEVKEGE